jgi:hypothetical protein
MVMNLRTRFLLANLGVIGGLILEAYRGISVQIIAWTGGFFFLLLNAMLLLRWKSTKSKGE